MNLAPLTTDPTALESRNPAVRVGGTRLAHPSFVLALSHFDLLKGGGALYAKLGARPEHTPLLLFDSRSCVRVTTAHSLALSPCAHSLSCLSHARPSCPASVCSLSPLSLTRGPRVPPLSADFDRQVLCVIIVARAPRSAPPPLSRSSGPPLPSIQRSPGSAHSNLLSGAFLALVPLLVAASALLNWAWMG